MQKKRQKEISPEQLAAEQEQFDKMAEDPAYFIFMMWGLKPQPPLKQYREEVKKYLDNLQFDKININHYRKEVEEEITKKDENGNEYTEKVKLLKDNFILGKHITWQQNLILTAIKASIAGRLPKRFSIKSGNGIGKSCLASWLILWFLYTRKDAQVPCTSPSEQQMFDVLWKEVATWISKMPEIAKVKYQWQADHIRILDYPGSESIWFARAKTARKENPEALSGVHAPHVLVLVDEASAVHDEIYSHARGALTSKEAFVFLISNPTRKIGYFFRSHDDKSPISENFNKFTFNSLESPVVDRVEFLKEFESPTEEDDEFRVFSLGLFPREESVDDDGYAPLFLSSDIKQIDYPDLSLLEEPDRYFIGERWMGIDPAGEGYDLTTFVIRDRFKAIVVKEMKISTYKQISAVAAQLIELFKIAPENVFIDQFGEGAKTVVELTKMGLDIVGVDVGNQCENEEDHAKYINIRARNYVRLKSWMRNGGEFGKNKKWETEFTSIMFARATERNSRIQIMSKKKMKKKGYKSPNNTDAVMITFCADEDTSSQPRTMMPNEREAILNDRREEAVTMNCSNF